MTDKKKGIQVISRAADVLRALAEDTSGLSLGQIARRVELPRSTVQRITGALAEEGLVKTAPGGRGLTLGPIIQTLAEATAQGVQASLRSTMAEIAEATGETVDLAVLDGDAMLFIDQIVGGQRLRTVSSIGERFPLTSTANGKAALAALERQVATQLAEAELTDAPELTRLLQEIESIRDGDLARDEDQHTDGVSALGFAIRDLKGQVFAISVPVPSARYARTKDDLAAKLRSAREELAPRT